MGKHFKDGQDMKAILGQLMEIVKTDEKVGQALAKEGILARFVSKDPDSSLLIDLKNKPQNGYLDYTFENDQIQADVTLIYSGDFCNRFWQGKENPMFAVPTGKLKIKGDVSLAIKLLPVIKPIFKIYKKMLKDIDRRDLLA